MRRVNGVHELIEQHAVERPTKTALVRSDLSITYEELNATANRVAHQLIATGVTSDRPVGILFPRGPEFVIAALAALKAGGCYLPMDGAYPAERLGAMIEAARPTCVLTSAALENRLPAGTRVLRYEDLPRDEHQPTHNPALPAHPELIACMIFTSGSTGKPKGVQLPHRGILRLVDDTSPGEAATTFGPDEVYLLHSALSFDAVTFELWAGLAHGSSLVIGPEHVPSLGELARILRRHRVSQLYITTGLLHLMISERPRALAIPERIFTGGDVLSSKRIRQLFEEVPDTTFVHGYGPAECTTYAVAKTMRTAIVTDRGTIPVGKAAPRTTVRVLDGRLRPVPPGESGEIYLGGDGLARGYVGQPGPTAARFIPDPFGSGTRLYATGDRVRVLDNGDIDFLGRVDHQVKVNGVRIELAEVEEHLRQHPEVLDAVVLASGESAEERRLTAALVLETESGPGSDTPEQRMARIRKWLGERLPLQMVPSGWQALSAFPMNPNGKIDRGQLARRVLTGGRNRRLA